MHNRSLRLVLALAFGVASASMVGCGPSTNAGMDTGNGDSGSNGNDSGNNGNDGSVNNDGSSNLDSGNGGSDSGTVTDQCLAFGNAFCDRLNTCVPALIQFQFGDVANCHSAVQFNCTQAGIPAGAQGINDPTGCVAAINGGTCQDFLNAIQNPPMACREKPGTVAENGACGYSSQCAAGLGCDLVDATHPDPRCMEGICNAFFAHGDSCDTTRSDECDPRGGDTCIATFSSTATSGSDGQPVCQVITYGTANADCAPSTNKQCAAGFYCATNHKCAASDGLNANCTQGSDHCDSSQGLACQPATTGTGFVCSPLTFVPEGAQCGLVSGQFRICRGDLYCDSTTTPTVCHTKKTMGQGCVITNGMDNCAYGLHCAGSTEPMPGTCQPPVAATCS